MDKRILITLATPLANWDGVAEQLRRAAPEGVDLAVPEFSEWHDRVVPQPTNESLLTALPKDARELDRATRESIAAICAERASAGRWGGCDSRACWTANLWADVRPETEFLIFFESPVTTIARQLDAAGAIDPTALLQVWRAGAERILRLARRHRARAVVVKLHEAAAYPAELVKLCSERFGIEFDPRHCSAAPAVVDSIGAALVDAVVRSDRELSALVAELEVRCEPLPIEGAGRSSKKAMSKADAVATLLRYRALRDCLETADSDGRELALVSDRLGVAEQATDAARAELAMSLERYALLLAEHGGLRRHCDDVVRENRLPLLQLQQVQDGVNEPLQACIQRRDYLENRLAAVEEELAKARAQAQEELAKIEARAREELARANAAAHDAEKALNETRSWSAARIAELEAALVTANAALESSKARISSDEYAALQQENARLLAQLQNVQKDLDRYFIEAQESRNAATRYANLSSLTLLSVRDAHIGAIHDQAPYRHVNFRLRGVVGGNLRTDVLDIRLVEHHGTPGIVLFAHQLNGTPPLSCWQESGREQDRSFMLIHPQHKSSRAILSRMTTADWLVVNDLAELMQVVLKSSGARLVQPHWHTVCARLREHLAELRPVLRYDGADVVEKTAGDGKVQLDIQLNNAAINRRLLKKVRLRWICTLSRGGRIAMPASLVFLAPEDGVPPAISSWPLTANNQWSDEFTLHFGRGVAGDDKRAQWKQLDKGDQDFVAGLLQALPAIIAGSGEKAALSSGTVLGVSELTEKMAREIVERPGRFAPTRAMRSYV